MTAPDPNDPRYPYAGLEHLRLNVVIRVGGTLCPVRDLAKMKAGDVIVLNETVGTPFDLIVGDKTVAKVEPVASGDGIAVKFVSLAEEVR